MLRRMTAVLLCTMMIMTSFAGISVYAATDDIIYVDVDAGGTEDGSSWADAFTSLQDALNSATAGDEIWVAEGTYTASDSDRDISFQMVDEVDVYGGFAGDETSRDERDWSNNVTVLSGEIGDLSTLEDNTKNIVIAADSILDGFTIRHGYSITTPGSNSDVQSQVEQIEGQPQQGGQQQGQPTQGGQQQGQLPQGGQPQGQPPQGGKMQGQLPQVGQPQGQLPQSGQTQGQLPQGGQQQGQLPQVGQPQGQLPQGGQTQGQLPQSGQVQGQLPQGGQTQGQPPQGGQTQDQPPQGQGSSQPMGNGNPMQGGAGSTDASVGHLTPESIMSGDASTTDNGAAIVIWAKSPEIYNCVIEENAASKGGAVYIVSTRDLESQPLFVNCAFNSNYAVGRGGAISMDLMGDAVFIDCVFTDNVCDGKGGAIYNDFSCSPLLENCLFDGNEAESGGAMANDGTSNPVISMSTFYGNEAYESGPALYQGSGTYNDPIVMNSIIWGNICEADSVSIYSWNESNPKIEYSIVEGGYDGEGVIDEDPEFIDPENDDFSLSDSSPGLNASQNEERIGFDADHLSNRTDQELIELIDALYMVEENQAPAVMDLSNPMLADDTSHVGDIIYVTTDGDGDGSSWDNALGSLQDAIDIGNAAFVQSGNTVDIFVEEGVYYTGTERSDSFILRSGLNLYGSFEGTETSLEERTDITMDSTLSGDVGVENDFTDNSYHVVIGADNVLLDGFTIYGGYADGLDGEVYDQKGGGLLNYHAGNRVIPGYTPTLGFDMQISNCTFAVNYAIEGGASYTYHGGNTEFYNCLFTDNTALYGGAVVDRAGVNSNYDQCTFEDNYAIYKGGAVFVDYGSMATFENCDFSENTSGGAGGAIYIVDRASQAIENETDIQLIDSTWTLTTDIYSSVLVVESMFDSNMAGAGGGAVYVYDGSNLKVESSEFVDNATVGEGDDVCLIYNSTLYVKSSSEPSVYENISYYSDESSEVFVEE